MRKWHRWAAIPAAVFIFVIALTGVLLHLDMIRVGQHPPGHEDGAPPPVQPLPSSAELSRIMARARAAIATRPDVPVKQITVDFVGPAVSVHAGAGGPPGSPSLLIDAATGRIVPQPAPQRDFHYILQDIHAGYVAGWTGRILSILCGLSLVLLSITGLEMWWTMRKRGKKGLWW